jgi:ketosteroid isomerase-like protein
VRAPTTTPNADSRRGKVTTWPTLPNNGLIADWHKAITARDIDALMALYTDDAVIESSAVLVLEKDDGGALRGKDVIRKHFQSFFATLDGESSSPDHWSPG